MRQFLWQLRAEQVVARPADAEIVVEELVVRVVRVGPKEVVAAVSAARLKQRNAKPQVRGVPSEWKQTNKSATEYSFPKHQSATQQQSFLLFAQTFIAAVYD